LHPLVTLLQYVHKMHGMNNLKFTTIQSYDSQSCLIPKFCCILNQTTHTGKARQGFWVLLIAKGVQHT